MMREAPIFEKIALIGAGLIGSSIAYASRRANLAGHIAGYVPRPETRARAEKMGFADSLHGPSPSLLRRTCGRARSLPMSVR